MHALPQLSGKLSNLGNTDDVASKLGRLRCLWGEQVCQLMSQGSTDIKITMQLCANNVKCNIFNKYMPHDKIDHLTKELYS